MKDSEILNLTSEYVFKLFKERLSNKLVYHTYKHTSETVNEARILGELHSLPPEQMELMLLSAWMEDTGYIDTYNSLKGNIDRLATEFLREHGYTTENITQVATCIRESKIGDPSTDLLTNILLDADMASLGKPSFEGNAEML